MNLEDKCVWGSGLASVSLQLQLSSASPLCMGIIRAGQCHAAVAAVIGTRCPLVQNRGLWFRWLIMVECRLSLVCLEKLVCLAMQCQMPRWFWD